MRYAVLSADYLEPVVRDENSGENLVPLLSGHAELSERLRAWNAAYQPIIPLEEGDRANVAELIEALDVVGIALTAQVANALGSKVRYYSEGRLEYVQ